MEMEAESYIQRTLDAVDADLAIALRGVSVAATEERAGIVDGQVKRGAGAELADIEVAAKGARRAGAKCAVVRSCDAHDAEERTQGNNGRRERTGVSPSSCQ